MNRVVHFEVPTNHSEKSRKFYENVLGWKLTKWEGPVDYWLITTGDQEIRGIDGGLGGAANEFHGTVNTVEVEDLDETLRKVMSNGGNIIMPKDEIPGVGWLAYIQEPGGAYLGLIQNMPMG
jgi:predicted enzyme related to lactoylglutathione lyase